MEEKGVDKEEKSSFNQEQVHDILFSRDIGWREIIYDLINTEQLDPWDVDITVLTDKYLERIRELEETDFFISSKVLFAAALLLRIKSEFLLNKYIKSIDEILFGKKEEKKPHKLERIELDEEIPEIVPKTPIPRFKKVTLNELVESLNKAINTENRRIKKEIVKKNALRETAVSLPKKKINIKDKIRGLLGKITGHFEKNNAKSASFSELVGKNRDDKIMSFSPLLHLESQQKIWLDQEAHFEEIYIWLKEVYLKHKGDPFEDLKKELEEQVKEEAEKDKKKKEKIEKRKKKLEKMDDLV